MYRQYSSVIIRLGGVFAVVLFSSKRNIDQAEHSRKAIAIPRAKILPTGASLTPLTPGFFVVVDFDTWYTVRARFPPQI